MNVQRLVVFLSELFFFFFYSLYILFNCKMRVLVIAEVTSWLSAWYRNVPGSGLSRYSRCLIRMLCTPRAAPCPKWGWWTGWRPEAGGTGAAAACRSMDSTAEGSLRPGQSTWSRQPCLHPPLAANTQLNLSINTNTADKLADASTQNMAGSRDIKHTLFLQ